MIDSTSKVVCVRVDPGICGFPCVIRAEKVDAKVVTLKISEPDCKQIKKLSEGLTQILLTDLFAPISRNPVYTLTETSSCHLSCPIPVAVIKAAEAAFGVALPRDVQIRFEPCDAQSVHAG